MKNDYVHMYVRMGINIANTPSLYNEAFFLGFSMEKLDIEA